MSRRTDIIITALVMLSLALVVASFVTVASGASGVHLCLCAVYSMLAALFVLVYARGRR